MLKFIFLTFYIINCYGITNFLISDYDFTNTKKYKLSQYDQAFSKYIKKHRVEQIYYAGLYYKINPLVLFTKLQCESGNLSKEPTRDIENYAFCCAIHLKNKETNWGSFNWQVWNSAYTLRKHYNKAKENNYNVFIYDVNKKIEVSNASTYSLYRYTPHYKLSGSKYNKNYNLGNFSIFKVFLYLKGKIND